MLDSPRRKEGRVSVSKPMRAHCLRSSTAAATSSGRSMMMISPVMSHGGRVDIRDFSILLWYSIFFDKKTGERDLFLGMEIEKWECERFFLN